MVNITAKIEIHIAIAIKYVMYNKYGKKYLELTKKNSSISWYKKKYHEIKIINIHEKGTVSPSKGLDGKRSGNVYQYR
jgi:hypothetical protein